MTSLLRLTLACLAFSAAVPGLQATISPSAFYDGFPFGRGWVQMLPPYNEHLIREQAVPAASRVVEKHHSRLDHQGVTASAAVAAAFRVSGARRP